MAPLPPTQFPRKSSPPTARPGWHRVWLAGAGLLGIGAIAGGTWKAWDFIQSDLAPLVSQNLSESIDRPVQVGALEGLSLNGLVFGPSQVPTHPYGSKPGLDQDTATVASVQVGFDLWQTLMSQTLRLDVTLVEPTVYLNQTRDGAWLETQFRPKAEEGGLKIEVARIQVERGTVTLDPFQGAARRLENVNGDLLIQDDAQKFNWAFNSRIDSGGDVKLKGQFNQDSLRFALQTDAKAVKLTPLLGFLPELPASIGSGELDGKIDVLYRPFKPLEIQAKTRIRDGFAQISTPQLRLAAKTVESDLKISYKPKQAPVINGTAQVKQAAVSLPEDLILRNGRSRWQRAQAIDGQIKFQGSSQQVKYEFLGSLAAGGQFKLAGVSTLDLSESNLQLNAQNVPAALMDSAYGLPIQVQKGQVKTNLAIRLKGEQQPYLRGWANLKDVDASIPQMPTGFYGANGDVRIEGLTANFNRVKARYGQVPLIAQGSIDPEVGYDLSVQVPPTEINQALRTLQVSSLPFPLQGQVEVPNLKVSGAIATPILTGTVQNNGEAILDRVPFEAIKADFRLDLPQLTVTDIAARPVSGGTVTGTARYDISPQGVLQANLDAQQMPGDAIAQRYGASADLKVGEVAAQIQITGQPTNPTTTVAFQAPQALYATQGSVVVNQGVTQLKNIVSEVAGGQVLTDGVIQSGQLVAQVRPQALQLATFSPELRGQLNGSFQVQTPIANASTQTVRADGRLTFSEGLSLISDPLNAAIAWNGNRILVKEATAPGFFAQGSIGADLMAPDGPQLTDLNLDLTARQFPLTTLATLSPSGSAPIDLSGTADLQGQLTGTLTSPTLVANLGLNDLQVSQVAFDRQLDGTFAYQPSGIDLDVKGDRDRIRVALSPEFLPDEFLVQRDDAIATGQRQGNILTAKVEQFPLQMFNLSPAETLGFGPIAGLASGNLQANLVSYATSGDFAVQQPSLGGLVGDRLTGRFRYQDGLAQLIDSELIKRDSTYRLNADLRLDEDPDVQGSLQVAQAQISDLLYVTQGMGGNGIPYGSAQDLQLMAVGNPQAPLLLQLQRLEEIKQLMAQETQSQAQMPLTLADLSGVIDGQINFQGSLNTGVQGGFNLQGTDVQWGEYALDTAIARGQLINDRLEFEPLRLASGDRVAQYTGSLGLQQQSGTLLLSQVPLDPLNQFLDLPVPVTGNLNGSATLGGNLLDPTFNGQVSLAQTQINDIPVQSAIADFSYEQARLQLKGAAQLDNPEPILLSANIPYALPFGLTAPTSNLMDINLRVKDEGLGLVSLFTDQVDWQGGKGLAALKIGGTLARPIVDGNIQLENATLATPTLEKPITAVNGLIRFDQNLLQVPQLVGQYDEGQIQVQGNLPIFDPTLTAQNNLQVKLQNLTMNLNSLYEGEIEGQLVVVGAAVAPRIGGQVQLQNGRVVLTDVAAAGATPTATPTPTAIEVNAPATPLDEAVPIAFDQLQVRVGDRVRISQPPVLSFVASGDLTVNGDLQNPRPEGTIYFQKGLINLFTSRFRIDPKRQNVAIFDPRYGVDPYLNLGMRSVVFDVLQGQTSELSDFATLPASSLGSVESVRVYADVDGFASELQTNFKEVVAITSDPDRSEGEIIALLGGGVTDAVEGENVQNAALNVASSALLGNVQDVLSSVLGNRATVNAFPVLLPDQDNDKSVLSFGAEVSYDVTDRFSVSALQILTGVQQPTLFTMKYDLTDQLRARTSISSDGEGVGLLEYRLRF